MSPTKGPHQSIRPRAPGALQGPTARRHPRPIGERGEPASWTGHEPGTSLSWSYLCRATLLEGQGLSICDDPWSTHRRCFRTPAAFCCVGILNRLEGGSGRPPPPPGAVDNVHPRSTVFVRTRLAKFLASAPAPPQADAGGPPKIWPALPRPLAGTSPKGSYFAPAVAGTAHNGALVMGWQEVGPRRATRPLFDHMNI